MKNLTAFFFLALLLNSCNKDDACPIEDNSDLFDTVWSTFSQEYAAFEILDIDWDELRDRYRPMVDENSTEEELFEVFKSLLFELKDGHVDLDTDSELGEICYYDNILETAPKNYIGWTDLQDIYLENIIEKTDRLAYGKVQNENIGYLRIRSFSEEVEYDLSDLLLEKFDNLDGIIVDIRNNSGGDELKGLEIASRFTESKVTYRYTRNKNGCQRNKLTDFRKLVLKPDGDKKFLGDIVLLTNKKTFSAGEDFTLMMKALPNVTHIGDDTWGGFGTGPIRRYLSNGWSFRVSRKVTYNLDKETIIGGIAPDEKIIISQEEEDNNKDLIIERAIEILR